MKWFFSGKLIISSPRSADSGVYTCHAENRVYRDQISATVQVNGKYILSRFLTLGKFYLFYFNFLFENQSIFLDYFCLKIGTFVGPCLLLYYR